MLGDGLEAALHCVVEPAEGALDAEEAGPELAALAATAATSGQRTLGGANRGVTPRRSCAMRANFRHSPDTGAGHRTDLQGSLLVTARLILPR